MTKSIRSHIVVNLIRTITLTLVSFITFPFVCRMLGDEMIGLYTWANSFVYYFLILAKVSIPNIAIRECVKVKDNKELFSHKVQEFFLLQCITTLLSFGLMCSIIFSVPELLASHEIIFILSINFLVAVFSFEWVFITLEKQVFISLRSIIVLAISSFLIFLYIKYPYQVTTYALFTVSVTVMTVIVNVIYLRKFVSFKKTMKYDFKQYAKPLLVLLTISISLTLYNGIDTFVLGFLDPLKAEVGSYSVGIKGIEIIITIITSLGIVFMPRANKYYALENKYFFNNLNQYSMNICFFIAIPAIATMIALATPITSLISGSYDSNAFVNAAPILMIVSSMMLTYSIGDIIYTQILLPMRKEKYYFVAMISGLVLNIGLSLLLGILVFSDNPSLGVAIATCVSDFLVLIILLYVSRKYSTQAVFNLNNLKIVLVGIVIFIFSLFITPYLIDNLSSYFSNLETTYLVSILIVIAVDFILYIVPLIIMKEKLISSFVFKKKVENNG